MLLCIFQSKHRLVAYSLIFVGFSIVAIYVVTLKIVKLDFRSLQQFVDSGIQDVARHFQLNTNQSNILEFMSNNNMTQISTQLDIEIVGKLVFIALHLLFATFNYILAVMLEVLVFLTCFAVCQLGYDFWDAVKSGSWSLQEVRLYYIYVFIMYLSHCNLQHARLLNCYPEPGLHFRMSVLRTADFDLLRN